MRRFITKILLISTFFIGLGAIADGILKALNLNELECKRQRIRIVKIENNSTENVQFQMILPNFDKLEKIEKCVQSSNFSLQNH